jgi:flagellar hook protein FlgE
MEMNALSSARSGMQLSMDLATRSAGTIASQSITAAAGSTTGQQLGGSPLITPAGDITKALIDQRQALTMFNANAKVIKADGQMMGSLLNISA